MFDIAFSELLVIAVVALLVIGPEKLPKVARTVGAFTGRLQRYVAQVKDEINRETRFEELQKLQQEIKQSVENTVENIAVNKVVKPSEHATAALQANIHAASGDAKINNVSKKPKKIVKHGAVLLKPTSKTATKTTTNTAAKAVKTAKPTQAKVKVKVE